MIAFDKVGTIGNVYVTLLLNNGAFQQGKQFDNNVV